MTDDAWAYRWSVRETCAEHGIRQKFIKPPPGAPPSVPARVVAPL